MYLQAQSAALNRPCMNSEPHQRYLHYICKVNRGFSFAIRISRTYTGSLPRPEAANGAASAPIRTMRMPIECTFASQRMVVNPANSIRAGTRWRMQAVDRARIALAANPRSLSRFPFAATAVPIRHCCECLRISKCLRISTHCIGAFQLGPAGLFWFPMCELHVGTYMQGLPRCMPS